MEIMEHCCVCVPVEISDVSMSKTMAKRGGERELNIECCDVGRWELVQQSGKLCFTKQMIIDVVTRMGDSKAEKRESTVWWIRYGNLKIVRKAVGPERDS
jgi:hypothetical protein